MRIKCRSGALQGWEGTSRDRSLLSFRIADCEVQSPFRAAWTMADRLDRMSTGSGWLVVVASPGGRQIGCKRSFSVFPSVVRVKRGTYGDLGCRRGVR